VRRKLAPVYWKIADQTHPPAGHWAPQLLGLEWDEYLREVLDLVVPFAPTNLEFEWGSMSGEGLVSLWDDRLVLELAVESVHKLVLELAVVSVATLGGVLVA